MILFWWDYSISLLTYWAYYVAPEKQSRCWTSHHWYNLQDSGRICSGAELKCGGLTGGNSLTNFPWIKYENSRPAVGWYLKAGYKWWCDY